jgi:hypothetical protein
MDAQGALEGAGTAALASLTPKERVAVFRAESARA